MNSDLELFFNNELSADERQAVRGDGESFRLLMLYRLRQLENKVESLDSHSVQHHTDIEVLKKENRITASLSGLVAGVVGSLLVGIVLMALA